MSEFPDTFKAMEKWNRRQQVALDLARTYVARNTGARVSSRSIDAQSVSAATLGAKRIYDFNWENCWHILLFVYKYTQVSFKIVSC